MSSREASSTAAALSGAVAGFSSVVVCSPMDVAKARIQVQGSLFLANAPASDKYKGVLSSLKKIWCEEGPRGWYRGFTAAVVTVPIFWSVYFPTYSWFKRQLGAQSQSQSSPMLVHMGSAAAAGVVCDVLTNPLWVVRTRLQTQHLHHEQREPYRGLLDCVWRIRSQEGWRAFYKGLTATLLGLSHVVVQFPLYEALKQELKQRRSIDRLTDLDIFIASTLSKLAASTVSYPHEVLRSRLQDQRAFSAVYTGLVDVARKTYRSEGLAGLYRGFAMNLFRVVPSSCITLLVYERCCRLIDDRLDDLSTDTDTQGTLTQ